MSTKNIYFFKVTIRDTQNNTEVPVSSFKAIFQSIIDQHSRNGALKLDYQSSEPIMLDVLEHTDSLLIGLFDNAIIKKIQGTGIIKKRNQHIMRGIIYATISVVSGLYLVFFPQGTSCFSKAIWYFFQDAEIVFMGFLIVYFLLSLREMGALVKSVYQSGQVKTEAEIKELKEQIKKSATKEK